MIEMKFKIPVLSAS